MLETGLTLLCSRSASPPIFWPAKRYDAETQGTIRKIMFDQKQKALGMPTSEELETQALLQRAKLAPGSPFLEAQNPN